jgi:hypothetical protein
MAINGRRMDEMGESITIIITTNHIKLVHVIAIISLGIYIKPIDTTSTQWSNDLK